MKSKLLFTLLFTVGATQAAQAIETKATTKSVSGKQVMAEMKKNGQKSTYLESHNAKDSITEVSLDLNADGKTDKIFVTGSSEYCGSAGCAGDILLSEGDSYRVLSNVYTGIMFESGATIKSRKTQDGKSIEFYDPQNIVIAQIPANLEPALKFSLLKRQIPIYNGAGCGYYAPKEKNWQKYTMADVEFSHLNKAGIVANIDGNDEFFQETAPPGRRKTNTFKSKSGLITVVEGKKIRCVGECSRNSVQVTYISNDGSKSASANLEMSCGS